MTVTLAVPTIVLEATHACRWCGFRDCATRAEHDRLFASGDTYARMTLAQRNTCPTCGGDVRDGVCPTPTLVTCPYCTDVLSGLLDACGKPECVAKDIAFAVATERWDDQ